MKIYKNEKKISKLIKSNISLSYTTNITPTTNKDKIFNIDKKFKNYLTQASTSDSDLFYHTAILVSTVCNKNDDIFTPQAVWNARYTPVDKPTNLEHDSSKIVGHITSSMAIDEELNPIAEDTLLKDIPSKFHVLVGAVIYKFFPDNEDCTARAEELLKSIEENKMFVSMEARFDDFDYMLYNEKEQKVYARNEETSFLSKYLRSYGGTGEYGEFKIARILKDISFIGKGYTEKPANKDSVIFTENDLFDFSKANFVEKLVFSKNNGVVNNSEHIIDMEKETMSDFYQEQNKKLEDQIKVLTAKAEEMNDRLAKSNVEKLEKEIESLKIKASDTEKAFTAKSDEVSDKDSKLTELQAKLDEVTKSNDELIKSNTELNEKLNKVEAEQKVQARISNLIAGGLTKDEAELEVNTFASLNDEQFKLVSDRIIEAAKSKKMEKDTTECEEKNDVKAEDLDSAKVTDEEVTSASVKEDSLSDEEVLFASLVKTFSTALKTSDINDK